MATPPAPDLQGLIRDVGRALADRQVDFMLVGGQAVLLHGAPRLTDDIDITLGVGPDHASVIDALARSLGLEPLPEDPLRFAQETFDERQAIGRAVLVDLSGTRIPFASAEDLIIHKLFAGRPRDWDDAVSVVRRQGERLDWTYIERWSRVFAEVPGQEDLLAQVARLRQDAR